LELALDNLDSADQAIERAQEGSHGDESFEDPKVIDGEKSPEEMLARLVEEYGPWNDDSEKFVMQVRI
jgi:hypothetical protein